MRKNLKHWGLLWTGVMFVAILAAACAGDAGTSVSVPTSSTVEQGMADVTISPEDAGVMDEPVMTAKVGNTVGEHVPEFVLNLSDGGSVTTSQLLADGKPVFLFFMATW